MSKYVDSTATLQVIGAVFKEPHLLDLEDKYTITENDFDDDFHKIVFGTIYKVYELGAEKISLQNIKDFLASRPKNEAIFNKNKGDEWLLKVEENCQVEAFDYYYGRLKKFSLLRAFDKIGVDVADIYDPDNIFDAKKKQQQEELLDGCSCEDLINRVNNKIEDIKIRYVDNDTEEASQAGKGARELVESLKAHPEVGAPLYGPLINTVTRGARLGKLYLRSAATGVGKAIPDYTEIPTPNGKRKVGDIKVGDYLFGQDGKPTKVLAVYPQEEEKEIWKVTFKDGRVAECCGEHLWEYRYETHRGHAYRTENTKTIYERALKLKNGFKDSSNRGFRFYIKTNEPVEYMKKEYSVDPYVMGALLGDGSFRYNNTNKSLIFSSENTDIPNLIIQNLGDEYYYTKNSEYNYSYTFRKQNNPKHPVWVEEMLKDFPELWQTKSETKFIPREYLQGSIEQRYGLLQGLMDTDGSIDSKGRTNFTTVSPLLRDDVIELCRSLGFVVTYTIDPRSEKYTTGECYKINIQCKKELKSKLFRLQRKIDIAEKYMKTAKREEHKSHLAIVNIEKTNRKTSMTCFTVENNDHLFLMNDYIVTHNTRAMVADACYIACNEIYDDSLGCWVHLGPSQPTLFIATEQDLSEIQTLMLSFLSNVNEEHILNGLYLEGEEERIYKAIEILENSPLYVETIPDFSLQDIENCIKKNMRERDISYCFYDYLHSSMKILEEVTRRSGGVKLREDNVLFMLATKLKDLCTKYGIFIMTSTQLNGQWADSETPDQNLLRGAKSIADRVDYGSILLNTTDDDLVKLEPILATNVFSRPTIKMSIYKNRRGRFKGVYLWCKADLGTCRIEPMFCTTYSYELVPIEDTVIQVEDEPSAF